MKLVKSAGSFDQVNTFEIMVPGRKKDSFTSIKCSLMQNYEKKDDGIYWALQRGGEMKSDYSNADKNENIRLASQEQLVAGVIVQIENEDYEIEVLGNFSNAAVFRKRTV